MQTKRDQIKQAMALLQQEGYYVGTLWSTNDVKSRFPNVSEEEAMGILDVAIDNECVFQLTWSEIERIGQESGHKLSDEQIFDLDFDF
jgi:hypothetical protein